MEQVSRVGGGLGQIQSGCVRGIKAAAVRCAASWPKESRAKIISDVFNIGKWRACIATNERDWNNERYYGNPRAGPLVLGREMLAKLRNVVLYFRARARARYSSLRLSRLTPTAAASVPRKLIDGSSTRRELYASKRRGLIRAGFAIGQIGTS